MAVTVHFDGNSEPPRPAGSTTAHAVSARPLSVAPGAVGGPSRPRRHEPAVSRIAWTVIFAAVVIGHAAGLRWRDAMAMSLLVFVVALVRPIGRARSSSLPRTLRSGRLHRPAHVFVVGDEAFCRLVGVAATGRRRVTGSWLMDDATGGPAPTSELLDQLSAADDLVIDAACFAAFTERVDWAGRSNGHIRVVPDGWPADRLFAHPLGRGARSFKRAVDVVVSLAGLLLTAPCLLVTILAIRLDSRGPALFRQVRVGEGGRRFTLYKLRTMTVGEEDPAVLAYMADMVRCQAEPENGMFKLGSNRRITRVGKWLRRLSLDEVPQLLNVLRGDMSLVGPRPPILEEAACYNEFHWQRLNVRPGITGLAQVNGRSRLRFDDIVALDVRYSRSWTPLLELKIILRTPAAVVSGRGAT